MDLHKLNPWNWFKHEESEKDKKETVPVQRDNYALSQSPFVNNISQLHHEIDRLFDDTFRGFGLSPVSRPPLWDPMHHNDFMPAFKASVDVASDGKQYTISLEAPGLEQKDVSLELKDRVLIIKGNKQQEQEESDKHYYRIERRYGAFERVLALPDDADSNSIHATMDKGLLKITIPRTNVVESEAKTIEISKG
ncbi:MAG: heat-shock protein Hsp20 [Nitrosomonas sp.]|nr:MAG: heat-shock protein Hsp20 [Nitrosomonas sp.]